MAKFINCFEKIDGNEKEFFIFEGARYPFSNEREAIACAEALAAEHPSKRVYVAKLITVSQTIKTKTTRLDK